MASKLFPSLAATAFAAILFNFLLKRRSSQIRAAANDAMRRIAASGYDYEVFLSFRALDIRAGFADFLYTSLVDAGIRAFKDDEDLRVGEAFGPKLFQAIKQSKILIPIFSKNYASSVWCLQELVQMVECQKTGGQTIMPIFYDVAPSEVRNQTGAYVKAFRSRVSKQRYGYDEKTISEWKDALNAVGAIKGWDLQSMLNRREGEFVRKLTQKVFSELKKAYLVASGCLVNVDNHVDVIMEMIGAGTNETRIIGIHGMGGIGKTTIANMIYNKLSHDFEICCFIRDIRERSEANGIQCLQNQLISDILKREWIDIKDIDGGIQTIKDRLSNKRVLLLLDDVDKGNHIDALVGKRDWLGRGSKIIITTRNKDILGVPEVDLSYELSGMNPDQSLQLFRRHAFRTDYPLDVYIDQSKRAIGIARGLPLALEVIGSLLCITKKEKWDLTLKKLENVRHATVQSKLKISYDALDFWQKHIFLDIACFFNGYDKDIMVHFWNETKFAEEDVEFLQSMSLIKIKEDNEVWMHDELRDLGREMVRLESKMKIEKQRRVWNPKEALDLLRRPEGKEEVEALRLKLDHEGQYRFTYEGFMGLSNLTFLEVDGSVENFRAEERLLWHESPSNDVPTNVFQENSDLLPRLRWLSWHKIPPTFKITNFSMEDVVILDLSESEITHDWKGWSHMKVMNHLKVLNLTGCHLLERTPNFSALVDLERLILRGCSELVEIDRSICQLKGLNSLDVRDCRRLWRLPEEFGGLVALKELRIDHTAIEEIPNCQGIRNLRIFSASFCEKIALPSTIGDLASLEYLSLVGCRSLERLPDTFGNLQSLIELDISSTCIKELPDSIGMLKNLKIVKMWDSDIRKIPSAFWTIKKLEKIEGERTTLPGVHVEIGNCIYGNQSLRILRLKGADIYALPRLPESLITLELSRLFMHTFPDLSNLTNLRELSLWFGRPDNDVESDEPVEEDPMPRWIGNLSKLETLDLTSDYMTTLPTDISSLLPRLQKLALDCRNLRCLPSLPSSLLSLSLNSCKSFCTMDLSNLKKLSSLVICRSAISVIPGLDCLENLQELKLGNLQRMEKLPDLSNFNKLRSLHIHDCADLVEIQGKLPQSLEGLEIYSCGFLHKLPNLSSLKGLQKFELHKCGSNSKYHNL